MLLGCLGKKASIKMGWGGGKDRADQTGTITIHYELVLKQYCFF